MIYFVYIPNSQPKPFVIFCYKRNYYQNYCCFRNDVRWKKNKDHLFGGVIKLYLQILNSYYFFFSVPSKTAICLWWIPRSTTLHRALLHDRICLWTLQLLDESKLKIDCLPNKLLPQFNARVLKQLETLQHFLMSD